MRSASDYGAHVRGLFINLVREGILRRQILPLEIHIYPDNRRGFLWRLPHFPSTPLTLEEALDFIRVNFYGPHQQRLVGHSLVVYI